MTDKRGIVEELHKPARKNFARRHVAIFEKDNTWQVDLVDMTAHAKVNKNYKFILTVIDVTSKRAYARALKSKNAQDVTKAFKDIFNEGTVPKFIQGDMGKEFLNKDVSTLFKKHGIHFYSTFSHLKSSIIERFNRSLKTWMFKEFSFRGTYQWIDILQSLIKDYNHRYHRSIGMKPSEVTSENEDEARRHIYKTRNKAKKRKKNRFKVGDRVRVSRYKHVFEKGYVPNWTTEIFTIAAVKPTTPVTYHLEDYQKNPILGGFYEEELQKTKFPDTYLVEKVLKRRGNRIFVKWLGFDSSHNSWINK